MFSCSPCEAVGGAGGTLLGGLELKQNLTFFDRVDRVEILPRSNVGWIECKFFTRSSVYLGALPESPVFKGDARSASLMTTCAVARS